LRKEALVPILLDQDAFPSEFAAIQATELSHWKGETDSTQMEALLRRLARLVPPSRIDTVAPAYLRTSSATNVGEDKDSQKRQLAAIERFAKRHGFILIGTFSDDAVSGEDDIASRPASRRCWVPLRRTAPARSS
jgi:hypothetical protein